MLDSRLGCVRYTSMQKLILTNKQCPGDVMMLSVAVRDLHKTYPGKYVTDVNTSCMDLWKNNPYITKLSPKAAKTIQVGYPLIHKSNQCGLHFVNGFIQDLNKKLNIDIKLTEFKADIHMSEEEKSTPLAIPELEPGQPYWLITSGGKNDFTAKWWSAKKWQIVVDVLKDKVKFVQVGDPKHQHPPLTGVINMVGKTAAFRDAMRLMYHSSGICTIVTCFMHLAAAFNKPCVCVAGGREPYTWEAYDCYTREVNMKNSNPVWEPPKEDNFVPQTFLHTIGNLSCCKNKGCWKSKIGEGQSSNCSNVVIRPGYQNQPKCMDSIQPDHVIAAVESYLGNSVTLKSNVITVSTLPTTTKVSPTGPITEIKESSYKLIDKLGV